MRKILLTFGCLVLTLGFTFPVLAADRGRGHTEPKKPEPVKKAEPEKKKEHEKKHEKKRGDKKGDKKSGDKKTPAPAPTKK